MTLRKFRFWCQKVIPLVYDDSLSYYEVLCKVVEYLNNTIAAVNENTEDIDELRTDLEELREIVDNLDPEWAKEVIENYIGIPGMVFPEITDAGYYVINIPGGWQAIEFNTTGLDIDLPIQPEYGHLVLSYDLEGSEGFGERKRRTYEALPENL